jgi:DNA adenine methylase
VRGGDEMSNSVSPLQWTGSKGCIFKTIDAFIPPHKTYIEPCMGSAEVFLRKQPAEREILNDYNGDLVKFFRVLQRNEKLAYL